MLRPRTADIRPAVLKWVLSLLIAALVSGCSSAPLITKRVYVHDNGLVRTGMTRKEVYSVAPPIRTPLAHPPMMTCIIGVPFYAYHHEVHEMNGNRVMDILYRRASEKEYRAVPVCPRTIDEGLFGTWNQHRSVPSEENRRDVVHRVSEVRPKGTPRVQPGRRVVIDMSEAEGLYSDVFLHPTGSTIPGPPPLKTFQKANSGGTPR